MNTLRPALGALTGARVAAAPSMGLLCSALSRTTITSTLRPQFRSFHASTPSSSWLMPKNGPTGSRHKGRPRVFTGGSMRGTTVVWGDYGVRMVDHHRRLSAKQLKNAEDTIRRKLRGTKFRLFMRISADIPVYTKGNETRMGTGKGSMDFWASRVHVNQVIFELKGEVHEQLVEDAFRVACNKMPGKYEFVKASDVPVMGTTKLTPENIEMLLKTKSTGITTHKFAKIAAKIAPEVVAKHQAELALATSKVASCEKPESARR